MIELPYKKFFLPKSLLYISYGIYLIFALLSTTFYFGYYYGTPYRIIKFIYFFLLLISNFKCPNLNSKSVVCLIICIGVYLNVAYNSGMLSDVAITAVFLYCLRDLPFETIAQLSIAISTGVLLFIIISSRLNIIANCVEIYEDMRRDYLGFLYCLYPATILSNVTALILYLRKKNIKWWECLILFLANCWMFAKTHARLSFYITTVTILAVFALKYISVILEKNKVIRFGVLFSYIAAASVSFAGTLFYTPQIEVFYKLNSILSGRLEYGKKSLELYGVSLFGHKNIEWVGNGLDPFGNRPIGEYFYVDNLYISITQRYGIVVLGLMLVIMTLVMFVCLKSKQYCLAVIFMTIAFRFVIDDLYISLHFNTFLIAAVSTLMKNDFDRCNIVKNNFLENTIKRCKGKI